MELSVLKSEETPSIMTNGSLTTGQGSCTTYPGQKVRAAALFVPGEILTPADWPLNAFSGLDTKPLFIRFSDTLSTEPEMVRWLPVAYPTDISSSIFTVSGTTVFIESAITGPLAPGLPRK